MRISPHIKFREFMLCFRLLPHYPPYSLVQSSPSYKVIIIWINLSDPYPHSCIRDWIVAQLMWADDGRLSMMRHADYLNAATSEAEAVAACYENIFECIERITHFGFTLPLMIIYVDIPAQFPRASLFVLSLIPLTFLVHLSRATETRILLEKRIRSERTYVSSLAVSQVFFLDVFW